MKHLKKLSRILPCGHKAINHMAICDADSKVYVAQFCFHQPCTEAAYLFQVYTVKEGERLIQEAIDNA